MRKLKLIISYDGTRYSGWQVQHRGNEKRHRRQKPTIQGTIENVLSRILQEPIKVVGSGRTDAGVHAYGQVAHVITRSGISLERLMRSANQLLPSDIVIMKLEEAEASFHARFSAVRKHYRYRVFMGKAMPPFIKAYVYHLHAPLNLSLMRREANAIKGRHNFQAFARSGRKAATTLRRVSEIRISRRGEELRLDIEGNGFLRTMVRSIAGTLLDVGRQRLPPGTIRRMLRTARRELVGTTAPAKGLVLMSVTYGRKPT